MEELDKNWEMSQAEFETGKRVFSSQAKENATLSAVSTKAFFRSISLRDEEIEKMYRWRRRVRCRVKLVTNGAMYPVNANQFAVAFFMAQVRLKRWNERVEG